MDPTKTLMELRELLHQLNNDQNALELRERLREASEKFAALDGWISRGGFLPEDWTSER